ncbi:MAG: glycine betaine ABC transporter substrate-binding protein [Bacillota bacterium]|nr:glycine betaine ABC transporter substrate-binding protein [Bacillota bacterium]
MERKRWKLGLLAGIVIVSFLLAGCSSGTQTGAGQITRWVFATDHEFSVRPDGLPELQKVYDFQFDDVQVMDLGVTYGALKEGKVPVAMGFATDGRIGAYGLVNLEDDKHFFPVYNPAPVVRKEVFDRYPELAQILQKISSRLDTSTMIELNGEVDIEGKEVKDVAKKWLTEEGILSPTPAAEKKGKITVGSKEFTEQLLVGAMTVQLLENNGFEVQDKTGLAGTNVVRQALETGEIDLYWEYTGTAWLTHLGHEEPITESEEAFQKVKEEDLAKNNLVWLDYADFDNTYTIMMRQEDAEALGIKTISDLARVIKEGK